MFTCWTLPSQQLRGPSAASLRTTRRKMVLRYQSLCDRSWVERPSYLSRPAQQQKPKGRNPRPRFSLKFTITTLDLMPPTFTSTQNEQYSWNPKLMESCGLQQLIDVLLNCNPYLRSILLERGRNQNSILPLIHMYLGMWFFFFPFILLELFHLNVVLNDNHSSSCAFKYSSVSHFSLNTNPVQHLMTGSKLSTSHFVVASPLNFPIRRNKSVWPKIWVLVLPTSYA